MKPGFANIGAIFRSGSTVAVLSPTNLSAQLIDGGILVTWTDSLTPNVDVELEASVDSGPFVLLNTIAHGVEEYTDVRSPGVTVVYRIRGVLV